MSRGRSSSQSDRRRNCFSSFREPEGEHAHFRCLPSSSLDAVRHDATWRHDRASYIFQTL